MLFHVKHVHTFESCPGQGGPEMISKTFGQVARPEYAKEVGVKVLGKYLDVPGHVAYFILDADSAEKVGKFLSRITLIGTAEITPVTDLAEEVTRKLEETKKK